MEKLANPMFLVYATSGSKGTNSKCKRFLKFYFIFIALTKFTAPNDPFPNTYWRSLQLKKKNEFPWGMFWFKYRERELQSSTFKCKQILEKEFILLSQYLLKAEKKTEIPNKICKVCLNSDIYNKSRIEKRDS